MPSTATHDPEAQLVALLERCLAAIREPALPAADTLSAKFTGTLGFFPSYFPEEIAHAGGLFPGNLLGGGNRMEMRLADARIGSFICSICRSTTELALNGSLEGMKAFITHPICAAAKHLAGIWSRNNPQQLAEILYLPQNVNSAGAVDYLRDEFHRLARDLEKHTGVVIREDAIRSSIRIYNENRRLLRELYRLRREEPWRVRWPASYLLLRARTRIPCEEHSVILAEALEAIRRREIKTQDKPRVVFLGGFCEQPPLEMLEAIDDACFVVDDDLLIGLRWFIQDVADTGDPFYQLALNYIEHSAASPVQHDERKSKEDYLQTMLRESQADAAILAAAKFCEPGLDDQLAWSKDLDQRGIPHLVLEFEEKMTTFEQMAMQVETVAEARLFSLS